MSNQPLSFVTLRLPISVLFAKHPRFDRCVEITIRSLEADKRRFCVSIQIRAAEDILALTRTMKELWLFGKLDTLGEDERDVKRREDLERDAVAVKNAIEQGSVLKLAK